MAFEIQSATVNDIPELVRVFHESFIEDISFKACYGAVPFKLLEQFHINDFHDMFSRSWVHFFKVVDTSNQQIAGFSGWRFCHPAKDEEACIQTAIAKEKDNSLPWHQVIGLNARLCRRLIELTNQAKGCLYNEETDFHLELIGVRPCYRRRGLGSLLVKEGLMAAEAMGAKVYLQASPLGVRMYKRLGFKPIAGISVDLQEFGGDEVMTEVCMVREAADESSRTIQVAEE